MTGTQKQDPNGIHVEFIQSTQLDSMAQTEKVTTIIEKVKDEKIIVLESGLDPEEQSKLVEMTMNSIDPSNDFTGISIETPKKKKKTEKSRFRKMVSKATGSDSNNSITVIGPSNRIETLKKDEDQLSTLFNV